MDHCNKQILMYLSHYFIFQLLLCLLIIFENVWNNSKAQLNHCIIFKIQNIQYLLTLLLINLLKMLSKYDYVIIKDPLIYFQNKYHTKCIIYLSGLYSFGWKRLLNVVL